VIKTGLLALASLAILAFVACGSDDPLSDSTISGSGSTTTTTPAPIAATAASSASASGAPAMSIDVTKSYTAAIVTENGEILIQLFAAEVPNTVNNFVHLSRTGFYDGVTFHRVLAGFMAQSGDPTGTGSGGPGYRFDDEFHPDLRHDSAGTLSMANSGQNTNGSQFFITFGPTLSLDGLNSDGSAKNCQDPFVSCHAVFGKVIEGMDVLGAIHLRNPASATTDGDVIQTIRIMEE